MKVLLVIPIMGYLNKESSPLSISDFPTGFAYIAAALKQAGHEVIGLNLNNTKAYINNRFMLQELLTRAIIDHNPQLIGLGGLCVDYQFIKDAIAFIRRATPAPIVLGGQIVTNDPEFIFNHLKPNYTVVGDGEDAMLGIAGGRFQPGIVQGTLSKVDDLPFPDYSPFNVNDMMDNHSQDTRLLYRYSRPDARPFVIVASRDCPFSCDFCKDHHGIYRPRSIVSIMAEIKETYKKYKYNVLIINDELFAVNKKRLNDFSNAMLEGKEKYGWDFDWMFQTHASAKLDIESLHLARKAGCYLFSYGLESAAPEVLKNIGKKIQIPKVIEAIEMARVAKLGFAANLIFGDPAETKETFAESLSFWLKYGQRAFIFLGDMRPYPGSQIFNYCLENKIISSKEDFYEHIDEKIINMTAIPDEDYKHMLGLISHLEQGWLFVAKTEGKTEGLGKIAARCPYCGETSIYQKTIPELPFMLGVGCTHCGQRIKVIVGGGA